MKFNEKLIQLRQRKKVSRKEMAKFLGMTEVAYGCYERGERTPNIEKICQLADYFEISVDELLGRNTKLQKAKEKWQNAGFNVHISDNQYVSLSPLDTIENDLINAEFIKRNDELVTKQITYLLSARNLIDITHFADMLFKKKYGKLFEKTYNETLSKFKDMLDDYYIEEIPITETGATNENIS